MKIKYTGKKSDFMPKMDDVLYNRYKAWFLMNYPNEKCPTPKDDNFTKCYQSFTKELCK